MSQSFSELGIGAPLTAALHKSGITVPTEIQARVIPLVLAGQDVLGQSATGTGKTLAYLLPLLQRIDCAKRELQAVILAPTYELAIQIQRQLEQLIQTAALNIVAAPMIGNVNIARQIEKLKEKPHIIVGSSGRILELIQKRKITAQTIKSIVLDEADRLLEDQNFRSVQAVIKTALRDRQLLLFSATVNAGTIERAKEFSAGFAVVRAIGETAAKPDIEHLYVVTEHRDKIEELRKLVHGLNMERGLVFVNKSDAIALTTAKLNYLGLTAAGLHGGSDKLDRKRALEDFRAGRVKLLVASDVAARGLDIAGIDYVVHLDVPDDPQLYLHRSGRTGRAGKHGVAVAIVARQEKWIVEKLEKSLKLKLKAKQISRGQVLDAGERPAGKHTSRTKPGQAAKHNKR
ncbi:DEAD/DEAH box helicase|uniref:Superfamily II DNA and RNA helicase n=1 Tax=Dendrosporobacter quercicolus TaxID=146817 RepID=A0A1G9U6D3_9FIRM|nr:DEAD/DEAH box helicase [Dendrosporobacter quercicolus]NSL48740.1 DEAD/DEAH box helicase [Dendrosporobacter quercicolus DSM 1736]SDM55516.1 Superfamily II DNA and RNA helicase [Dendrosporobacter quercicolus]